MVLVLEYSVRTRVPWYVLEYRCRRLPVLKTIPVGDGGDSCRGSKTRLCDTEGDNNAAARAGNARDLGVETGAGQQFPS